MTKYLLFFSMFAISCGGTSANRSPEDTALNDLKAKVEALTQTSNSINSIISSDYASCPASGDTSDALIRKICNVAQASTSETRVALKAELATFQQMLSGQIDAISSDLVANSADVVSLQGSVATLQADVSTLQGQMTSANAAILALQNLTASITGNLAGNLISLDIGNENVSAGPLYETVLRRFDKKRFNGYVQAYATAVSLGNNPLTASNASSTLTVTYTAHGFLVNDLVNFTLLQGGRGLTSAHVYGDFRVLTVPNAGSFTIKVTKNATSSGTLGSSAGIMQKVSGRGMSTLWSSGDASDVAVRISNLGNKRYNFIIRRIASDVSNNTAELCYDTTNNLATFGTINAAPEGGAGNITCK